jgi:RimJ/RimL family protein N-acetyltransferase
MIIRPARVDDIETLLDLYEEVAAEGKWIGGELPVDRDRRRESWTDSINSDKKGVFVAEVDGRIVGHAALDSPTLAGLGMMVAPGRRNQGVGSLLVRACIDWAREVGVYKITLQVWPHNTAAIALYEKFGFEQEGYLRKQWRRRSGELWDAIVMGLVLEDSS